MPHSHPSQHHNTTTSQVKNNIFCQHHAKEHTMLVSSHGSTISSGVQGGERDHHRRVGWQDSGAMAYFTHPVDPLPVCLNCESVT